MAPEGSVQAARTDRIVDSQPQSSRTRYLTAQAEAIHRIYAPIHFKRRLHVILKALDQPRGAPHGVEVKPGLPTPDMIDATYLGTLVFEPLEPFSVGDDGDPDLTIIAPVPRQARTEDLAAEKTAPDFRHHPVLGPLLWRAPVLFEQGKYLLERRREAQCASRHTFLPMDRATRHPLGVMPERSAARPPAILIGFHWLETGGAEKLAFDCVTWARKAGLRVLVVAERADIHRHAGRLPDDAQVKFIRADAYLHPDSWAAFLESLVQTENVRALHIHHNLKLYDSLMRLKAAFPDLVVIDSTHIVEYADGGYARVSGVWTRYIDYHHVISRNLATFYLDRFGVSEKVVLGRMQDSATDAPEPRLRLAAGQKSCRIAFVGRMVHQKRAPLVVEIVRKLREWCKRDGIELQVDMVGTGAYLDVVRHMIHKAQLSKVITLHPPEADVPALLAQSDILLLPSSNEGLALVCYEAIQQGALPISTDVGAQDELVPEDLLLPRAPLACVKSAVALIQRLMTDPAFLQDCKAETLTRYRALRADPTAEEVLSTLYGEILERSTAP